MCWLEILKNHVLTCHLSLILYSNSESLLRLWHVMKSGFYATASSVVGPRNSKALPKAKLAPKKRSWSLFGGLLSVWSTTAFWIPAKPLNLRNMLSKSMRYTKNCSACSQQWSTEWAQFSTTTPSHMSHNQHFKIWTKWATNFAFVAQSYLLYLPDFLPTDYLPLLQTP